jgi:site-specific recombinase XerD
MNVSFQAAGILVVVAGVGPSIPNLAEWLTVDQSKTLLAESPSDSLRGKRDRAILALVIVSGLRQF